MPTLEEQRQEVLLTAKGIVEKAQADGRDLTTDEASEAREHLKKAEDLLAQIKRIGESNSILSALGEALKTGEKVDGEKPKFKTLGEAFVASEAYRIAAQYAKSGSGRFTTPAFDTGLSLKALTTLPNSFSGPNLAGFQELPMQLLALNRPTIADLFGSGTMSGSTLTYLEETTATNNAATVAEGAEKPASVLTLTRRSKTISKIATVIDVPDEVLEDLDQARSYIDGRLSLFVQMEEEQQLVSGDGTGTNITGLLNTSGTQTETAATEDDNLDALYRAITKVRTVALLEPDGVAINPLDYQYIRLTRDGNEQYYGGGPFTGAYGNGGLVNDPGVWGLRTVVTPAVPAGTAVVGAWQVGGAVFRKGGITVDATNSDGEKFRSNITTIRAEERVGLAIYRPAAFVEVTLDTTAGP